MRPNLALTITLTLALIALIIGGTLRWSELPQPLQGESAAWLAAGDLEGAEIELALRDHSRATLRRGDLALPFRDLPTTVWYPRRGGGYPLILFSHGYSQPRRDVAPVAQALVHLGFVVAAADFPLTNHDLTPEQRDIHDVVNQPGDVSFVIDRLLERAAEPDNPLAGKIDGERIGALGTSLGGLTTTLLGLDPRRRDPRVKAIVAQAAPAAMFAPEFFARHALPALWIAGTADLVVDYDTHAASLPAKVPGSLLLTIAGGSHCGFGERSEWLRWLDNPDAVLCRLLSARLSLPSSWDLLGTPADGILAARAVAFCTSPAPPSAINPLRQKWLSQLAVTSFFESQFNPDPAIRSARQTYLMHTLPREIPEVSIQQAALPLSLAASAR